MIRIRKTGGFLAFVASVPIVLMILLAPQSASAVTAQLSGRVLSGPTGLSPFVVTLHASAVGQSATELGSAVSAADGSFNIMYTPPADPKAVLYVLAKNQAAPPDAGAVTLASVLGTDPLPDDVVVNELTTVATSYAMAQFTDQGNIGGPSPGLQNAAGMSRNLVDPITGALSSVVTTSPNIETSTKDALNSLANMLAACVASAADCTGPGGVLDVGTTPEGGVPTDTFQALVNIAHYPWNNVAEVFALAGLGPMPYSPALNTAPDAWTLALRFNGDGTSINGPGNFVIDHDGFIWVNNNYQFSLDPNTPVCGSDLIFKFTPTGEFVPGSPFSGGGLNGAGFGIGMDPLGNVWVGNFGFAAPAPNCQGAEAPPHNSVSKFSPAGVPLSPSATGSDTGGFTQGDISWPQATVSDKAGNIWIANCGNDSVTVYPQGDPSRAKNLSNLGITQSFDIAHNNSGQVFITGAGSDTVAILEPDGSPAPNSPVHGGGLDVPIGIAADSAGNMWVANQAVDAPPCPDNKQITPGLGSLTLIGADGVPVSDTSFRGGGITLPWGVAVDGNDNVWAADFATKRVSQFCGVARVKCRPGSVAGDPISPDVSGYSFDGLRRSTGVAIDPSGNVWLTNNWKEVAVQTNPGGYEIVAFIGMAGPVQRPAPRSLQPFTG